MRNVSQLMANESSGAFAGIRRGRISSEGTIV
jgi:hypothetical protein